VKKELTEGERNSVGMAVNKSGITVTLLVVIGIIIIDISKTRTMASIQNVIIGKFMALKNNSAEDVANIYTHTQQAKGLKHKALLSVNYFEQQPKYNFISSCMER
jgi:hypothetical protein